MSAKLKFILFGAALLAASPLLLFILLRIGALTPLVNWGLSRALKPLTSIELRVGSVRSDVLHFLEADDVVLLAPLKGAKVPLLTVASLRLEYDAYDAWRGKVPKDEALKLARIRGLSVFVLRDKEGNWNTSVLLQPRKDKPVKKGQPMAFPLLPAGRVELEDSQVVFNDESKSFHSSIERLQGSLDTRALPLLVFSLAGRTEGVSRDNLSMAGEADLRTKSMDGRLDLAGVELKEYLNYVMPGQGLRFEGGKASLSARLRTRPDQELLAEGRADLEGGRLRIPGVAEPLSDLNGRIAFDPQALRFHSLSARFLSSVWTVEGGIDDLRHPRFDLRLKNPAFGLDALSQQIHGLQALTMTGSAQVDVSMVGPAKSPLIQGTVSAPWMSLAGIELQDSHAQVEMQGPHLRVEGIRATVWDGSLQGSAALGLGKDGRVQADMVLDGVRLEQASIHGQRPLPLSGTAFLELKLQGPVHDPSMKLRLEVGKAYLGFLPLGRMEADADWAPEAWSTEFGLMDGRIKGKLEVSGGKHGVFHDSSVSFRGIDLGPLAHGIATAPPSTLLKGSAIKGAAWFESRLQGQADAKLSLEGPLHEPAIWVEIQRLKGTLDLKQGIFALQDKKKPLDLEGEGGLGFSAGDALFGQKGQPLRLRLSHSGHQWEAQALGRYPLHPSGRPGALDLNLEGDLGLLDAFAFFKNSGGHLSFDGRLGGSADAPQARGDLRVDNFKTDPAHYLAPITGGSLRAQLLEQVIDVPELKFTAGGQLVAKGRLDLSAGLRAMSADLELNTDEEGLRLENWEAMGTGNLVLAPLHVVLSGEGQPIGLSGRLRLSNAVIVYAGQAKKGGDGEATEPPAPKRVLDLDLRVGLGSNVWYEKLHDKQLDILDPSQWIKGVADSAMETLQRPDMYFRLRPTDKDFVIQGQTPDIQLQGELAIDRGRITVMENEFEIRSDRTAPRIRFAGKRAEVWASAVARLRYNRDNPLTRRPQAHAVNVILDISPLDEEELERSGMGQAFLNYKLDFSSDPEIIQGNAAAQREAILNLVVLGDPIVDLDSGSQAGAIAGAENKSAESLGETQVNRLISGEFRKQLASWSRKGFKFLGTGLIDVFRVVPRFKFQAVNNSSDKQGTTSAADASKQAKDNQLIYSDTTLELGKSLTERLYGSFQYVNFGEQSLAAQAQAAGQTQRLTRNYGTRLGVEYQISANRTLEGYWNYSVDDNLEPVPFEPDKIDQAHSGVVRLRNTIPTGTYTSAVARERRWGSTWTAQP